MSDKQEIKVGSKPEVGAVFDFPPLGRFSIHHMEQVKRGSVQVEKFEGYEFQERGYAWLTIEYANGEYVGSKVEFLTHVEWENRIPF